MLEVLYEDNHLLVVNKPAGLPTQGAAEGEDSVVVRAKQYLKQKYVKPGGVYVGVVSRLDALVTGTLVLARTSKAAARLNEQFRERTVGKVYWAVVDGKPASPGGSLSHFVAKDDQQQRMIVVNPLQSAAAGAQSAILTYRVLTPIGSQRTLLEVNLTTGRKHQIRVQMAHCGWPVVGDRKYGSRSHFSTGIALHARRLEITHPTQGTALRFIAPLPGSWRSLEIDEEKAVNLEAKSLQ